jgi:hypothetical protein
VPARTQTFLLRFELRGDETMVDVLSGEGLGERVVSGVAPSVVRA